MGIAKQTYTHEMLGLNETIVITDEDVELLNSISLNNDDGGESLQRLRNKWGDFAYADFAILQYFTEENSENFRKQLSKAIKLYPGNAMIRMEQYAQILLNEPDSCTEIIFDEYFNGKDEITRYEMFRFQTSKLTYFTNRRDIAALEAMYYQLEDILDNESEYFITLNTALILMRMRLLKEGFLKNLF